MEEEEVFMCLCMHLCMHLCMYHTCNLLQSNDELSASSFVFTSGGPVSLLSGTMSSDGEEEEKEGEEES